MLFQIILYVKKGTNKIEREWLSSEKSKQEFENVQHKLQTSTENEKNNIM